MTKLKAILEFLKVLSGDKPSDIFIEFLHSPIVDLVVNSTPNKVDERIVMLLRAIFPKPEKKEAQ